MSPFTLEDFVTESNRIEGLGPAQRHEITAHEDLLSERELSLVGLAHFVAVIAGAGLRQQVGMDVRVGRHLPPPGGPKIVGDLQVLLRGIGERRLSAWEAHRRYETLHPFMDGNGRSGRALWLWQMGGIRNAPLGFLHTFYYQTLDASRFVAVPPAGETPE